MDNKIHQMNKQKTAIINFAANTKKTAKVKQTKGFLKARCVLLEQYWTKYCALYDELMCMGGETAEACKQEDFDACEIIYAECMGELSDFLETMSPGINNSDATFSAATLYTGSALPHINLPTFDGNYLHWFSFKDMFISMVTKNASLCNTQRLQYLKDSLKGEAQHTLDNITTTDSNFSVAWNLLEGKYENKRVIINAHLTDIMNLPVAQKESASALRHLSDGVTSALRALEHLGRHTEHWDDWLVYILVHKLDPASRKSWEMSLSSTSEVPTFESFKNFLDNRMHSLEIVQCYESKSTKDAATNKTRSQAVKGCHTTTNQCVCCQGNHFLYACDGFRCKPSKERLSMVRSNNLCYNCLHSGHQSGACPSKRRCKECAQAHHPQLHECFTLKSAQKLLASKADNEVYKTSTSTTTESQQHAVTSHNSTVDGKLFWSMKLPIVILGTTLVEARSESNQRMVLRALEDPGAEATFVSENVATLLRLRRTPVHIPVSGASGKPLATATTAVQLILGALHSDFEMTCTALVLPRVGNLTPSTRARAEGFREFQHLELADPKYYEPASIDMILSAADYAAILCSGLERSKDNKLVAQETKLGWVVFGEMPLAKSLHHVGRDCYHANIDLNATLQKFWALEEVESPDKPSMSNDELFCENFFDETTQRGSDGRYIVRLPVKTDIDLTKLNTSKQIALASLRHGLRRLENDDKMQQHYQKFMSEYETLGHMEAIAAKEAEPGVACYLPHHGVWKEASTTTKLRIVFNAARQYDGGLSLNDCLHIGPKLQNDLVSIFLNWRRYRVAFTGDIEKMYRQIRVSSKDTNLQRIFWRRQSTEAPTAFRLLTVTYGTNCAPYLAIRVLHTLANDHREDFANAAWSVVNEFYVDDVLSGGDSAIEATRKRQDLQSLLKLGGFSLRKFNSNSNEVLKAIDESDREYSDAIELSWEGETKALGVLWLPKTDELSYKFKIGSAKHPCTKRQLASDLAKLFDPLGLLAPVIISGKIMVQELWRSGLNWDDPLPHELQETWQCFREELQHLADIKIARWIMTSLSEQQQYQLHIFADASSKAYGAVAYVRVANGDVATTTLLTAKTKVAPLKKSTIPHLELCAAVLAAKLLRQIQQNLRIEATVTLWSDSRTVLCWIRAGPGHLKQFEANRIAEILKYSCYGDWKYVPTGHNPADVASRGTSASQLVNHDLWWQGPTWLSEHSTNWPDQSIMDSKPATSTESKQVHVMQTKKLIFELLNAYSDLNKLLAILAWCLRFINAKMNLPHATEKFCTYTERAEALHRLIWYVQHDSFNMEIKCLQRQKPIPKQSRLIRLNPVLDQRGILRLGGRLANANIPLNARYPTILPKDSRLTQLLIAQAHTKCLHGGTQVTLHYLRQNLWILDGRAAVKRHILKCVTCFKQKGTSHYQLMGDLPSPRCNPALPFLHSGVDYAGPVHIRTTKGRGHRSYKGYVALFVCLATRAIHLELVSDLTTQTFLEALHRFVACRGLCSDIYSDQGTTFVGADALLQSELSEFKTQLNTGAVECSKLGINWHFIPPAAPNFGGLWEAGVKSMKKHLKRVIGSTTLTFEELYTVLKRIEACLNSRPIARINDDPNDFNVLTPGHFLVGRAITNVPVPSVLDTKMGMLFRWKLLRQLHQDFWRRWAIDYLHEIQTRTKWYRMQPSAIKGQLVLLRDERLPPSHWSMGVIDEVHPGHDGIVRVITVRTSKATFKRPITKISILPIDDNYKSAATTIDVRQGGRTLTIQH